MVVIKARGQDIFCSLPLRADGGSGDEGSNGAGGGWCECKRNNGAGEAVAVESLAVECPVDGVSVAVVSLC